MSIHYRYTNTHTHAQQTHCLYSLPTDVCYRRLQTSVTDVCPQFWPEAEAGRGQKPMVSTVDSTGF